MDRNLSTGWTLGGSITIYSLVYLLNLPSNPSFIQVAKTREAISIIHCSFQTILSVACLRHHADSLAPTTSYDDLRSIPTDSHTPIIATKSAFGNTITAIETGYLLQDSFVLFHAYYTRSHQHNTKAIRQLKGWNLVHLSLHHGILAALLLVLQHYIARSRERGILVIVALHLMNASSIPGTGRWFLRNFYPRRRSLILASTVMYLTAFAVSRVYLIYWILDIFGKQQGISAWSAIAELRAPCRVGTGLIAAVNAAWLASGIRNFALGILRPKEGGKRGS